VQPDATPVRPSWRRGWVRRRFEAWHISCLSIRLLNWREALTRSTPDSLPHSQEMSA